MNPPRFVLNHSSDISLCAGLSESAFLASLPMLAGNGRDMRTGWVWYRLPAFEDSGVLVSISAGFNLGVLEMLLLSDSSSKYGSSWDDWSEARERDRAASITKWLSAKGYSSGQYGWGSVWSGYDPKGGSGCASIRLVAA